MKIALAADHRGRHIMPSIRQVLQNNGCTVMDMSCNGEKTLCDYPDLAYPVARSVADGTADMGILVCGTGIGMSIAANKLPDVRAALVHDEIGAEMARRHNNANVLCLSADLMGPRLIERVVEVWLSGTFEGGRHARRVEKIGLIEQGLDPRTAPGAEPVS